MPLNPENENTAADLQLAGEDAQTGFSSVSQIGQIQAVCQAPQEPCRAILTFDDGPLDDKGKKDALYKILAALYDRATIGIFYVLGKEVKQRPDLAVTIVKYGHVIQSHSWDHRSLITFKDKAALIKNLEDTQTIIHQSTGVIPDRLRPPYGAGWVGKKSPMLIESAGKLKLTLTGWDVDTNDWRAGNKGLEPRFFEPARAKWKDLYRANKRPVDILMHVRDTTAAVLGKFMDELLQDNWQFTIYDKAPTSKVGAPTTEPAELTCH